MRKLLRRLQLLGSDLTSDRSYRQTIITVNQVILWIILLATLFMLLFAALSIWILSFVIFAHIVVFGLCLWFNDRGWYSSAKLVFIMALFSGMYAFRAFLGDGYFMDMLFLSSMTIPFVLTGKGERYLHLVGIVMGIGGISLYNFTGLSEMDPLFRAPEFIRVPLMLVAFFIPYLSLRQFKRSQFKYEERLLARKAVLRKMLERLRSQNKVITENNQKLNEALLEREELIKEIHHRVKNNMQIIKSLLNLRENTIEDKSSKSAFVKSKMCIQSMAMVHDILYQANDFSKVDYREYLKVLLDHQMYEMNKGDKRIDCGILVKDLHFNMNTSVPLGMLISEILSNTVKDDLNGSTDPSLFIEIEALKYPNFRLKIGDNGKVFNRNGHGEKPESDLTEVLAEQLNGSIKKRGTNSGILYVIDFEEI